MAATTPIEIKLDGLDEIKELTMTLVEAVEEAKAVLDELRALKDELDEVGGA